MLDKCNYELKEAKATKDFYHTIRKKTTKFAMQKVRN